MFRFAIVTFSICLISSLHSIDMKSEALGEFMFRLEKRLTLFLICIC